MDCSTPAQQRTFANGLTTVGKLAQEQFGKPFGAADAPARLTLLTQVMASPDAETKAFGNLLKSLTIKGYMTSEYVLTNFTDYQMAPGFYKGCVPVSPASAASKSAK